MAKIEADAYADAKANGMAIIDLSPEEIEKWRTASAPVLEDYLAASGELGARVAKAAESLR
jgi:C4-dicarboxylate-binding protein DctP